MRIPCTWFLKMRKERKKKFSPSRIKGFTISGREYVPMYLPEFDLNYFLAVRQKGNVTLFQYEDINNRSRYYPSLAVATLAVADEAYSRSRFSGYYIKKAGNDTLFAVPGGKNILARFILKQSGDNEELVLKAKNEEYDIHDIQQIVSVYNYYAAFKKE